MKTYEVENGALVRMGSFERFNRVLYGGHAHDDGPGRFFTFAGDVPLFMGASSDYRKDTWCYQAKNGVLMSGFLLTPGHVEGGSRDIFSKWFHDSGDVIVRWQHGYLEYELTQFSSYFPSVRVKITVLPLNPDEGYLVHYDVTTDQRVIFCAGFGGITPFFGRFEYHHSLRRDFSPEDCADNTVETEKGIASVSGPLDVTMLIGDDFGAEYSADAPEAMCEKSPSMFLADHSGPHRIVKLSKVIGANERFQGTLAVLRNGSPQRLRELLRPGTIQTLKQAIRRKYASVSFTGPDALLNMSVPDTLTALDASFHGNSFYHGAVGYHAPFLGWRGWYAPALVSWKDRVKSAILSHFDTILRSGSEEKVWYDGADRPDLDHEGTQYHHLANTHGRLTALLYRDDIYDMQEVAVDMTLFYFDFTRDAETAAKMYDRLLEVLDWQERILDPDGDGLYQNFLNTWISDGHCYNGAGCAQASCYNLRANERAAALGRFLGRDTAELERRAAKIRAALAGRLWLEDKGVLAESADTVGSRLIHPSPELSTIYLALECDALQPVQAVRMLLWAKHNLRTVTTCGSRKGKLYYSSRWLPKKYSTYGLFPAENAAFAMALFKAGLADEAMEIVNGLADAFELTPNPGSIQHVLADSGAADSGDIDFTDVSGCYLRMLFEGLWGVRFMLLDNRITLAPQLPDAWQEASLSLPSVSLFLHRESSVDTLTVFCETEAEKTIILPVRGSVETVLVNGKDAAFELVPGIRRGKAVVKTSLKGKIELKVFYSDLALPSLISDRVTAFAGERFFAETNAAALEVVYVPAGFEQCSNNVFRLPSGARGGYDLLLRSGSAVFPLHVKVAEEMIKTEKTEAMGNFETVDLSGQFNISLTEVHQQKFLSPRPKGYSIGMRINGRYAWEWNHYGHNALRVEDTLLRQAGGVFTLPSGIPLETPAKGPNTLAVSVWDNFPSSAVIPLNTTAKRLHFFLCGTTNAMQSEVVNAKLTAVYEDGTETVLELIQPDNFDDFLIPTYQRDAESFYVSSGTHGLHYGMNVRENCRIREIRIDAVANEVIVMLLGITLEK